MEKSLTSVCAWCKRVREGDSWVERDTDHEKEDLSHGCCPSCLRAYHPSVADSILGPSTKIEAAC